MADGALGFSFDPSQSDIRTSQNGGGIRTPSPAGTVNVLSLRLPKTAPPTAIAPLPLLTSHGAASAGAVDPQFLSLLSQVLSRQASPFGPFLGNESMVNSGLGGGSAPSAPAPTGGGLPPMPSGGQTPVSPGGPFGGAPAPSAPRPPRVIPGGTIGTGNQAAAAPAVAPPPFIAGEGPSMNPRFNNDMFAGSGGFFQSILQGGSVPRGSLY